MTGGWAQSDATTPLPGSVGGGDLNVDATLELDGRAVPATFGLDMNLEARGLADTITATGTYDYIGSELTLTFTGFVIDPASGNTAGVSEDGSQCIFLQGFAGTAVCFQTPQTNSFVLEDTLTITLDHVIAGAPESQTTLTLNRSL